MSAYSEFFLSSSRAIVPLQLLQISHPSFSTPYYKVRNARGGVTVTLEDSTSKTFDYLPMEIIPLKAGDDMDTGISVKMGDLGKIISMELDLVESADTFDVPPTVIYRVYRSDVLSAPLYGPIKLQVRSFSFNEQGLSFEAKAPRLNYNKTGELYLYDRFPMLRGFL